MLSGDRRLAWDHLQSFLAVAREGTLSGAARALNVTQSTMGRRLEALSRHAGSRFLDKTPEGYVLTDAGRAVFAAVEQMEEHAFDVERSVVGTGDGLAGDVRITTVESFGARIVTPILASLLRTAPGVRAELISDQRDLSLARRECDIALRLGEFEGHETVISRIGAMAFAAYVSAEYLERRGDPVASAGEGHDLIACERGLERKPEAAGLVERLPRAKVRLRANSRQAQAEAAAVGTGVAMLPCHLGAVTPGLVEIATPLGRIRRDLWIGVHRDNCNVPRIRLVADELTRGLRAAASRLDPP